jgi:hypothetical protein
MRAWLTPTKLKGADTRLDVFTIEQRLNWLCDPTISADRYGHLFYLCKSLRLTIMMRHMLPSAVHGDVMERGRKLGTIGEHRERIRYWLKKFPYWRKMAVLAAFENAKGWSVDWKKKRVVSPTGHTVGFSTIGNYVSKEKTQA